MRGGAVTIVLWLFFNGAFAGLVGGNTAGELGSYNIDTSAISVSGLSSGGFMAAQIHVVESKTFMGAGVIAGGPYGCAEGQLSTALTACMSSPYMINVNALINNANQQSNAGTIDPLENLANTKVYMYAGTEDTTVKPGVMDKTGIFYEGIGVQSSNILYKNDLVSVHGFPTMDYGTACGRVNNAEYINDCNYDSAYELLNHIYDHTLTQPTYSLSPSGSVDGTLISFDQKEFADASSASAISMDDLGYLYVPESCADGTKVCKLHVAFHGCHQGTSFIGKSYADNTGYNRVAALNDIIVLYPQATTTAISNPNGCWDFWAYTGADYAFHSGKQIKTVMNMIARLTEGSNGVTDPITNPPVTTTEPPADKTTISSATTTSTNAVENGLLGSYGADNSAVSVSGLGSGAFMAIQVHVAESDRIMGAGAISGGPYYCAQGSVYTATSTCMSLPIYINLDTLYADADAYMINGDIASLFHLEGKNVYLYSGSKDISVSAGVVEKAHEFYAHYNADTAVRYDIPSRDAFPTMHKGSACGTLDSNSLNSCGFSGAHEILNHIYGGTLQEPDYLNPPDGILFNFDQNEVIGAPASDSGLSDYGKAFVPTACAQGQTACRVHVAFHGCKAGSDDVADAFAADAGYNEVAAANNIIMIYPRTKINYITNIQDCWDWWGYTNQNYATSQGPQIQAIIAMIDRVTS